MSGTLLVDGNNLLKRALFAAQGGKVHLSNEDGIPTAALHIWISMMAKYTCLIDPEYLVVCWDGGRSRHRMAIFDGYKAARADKPEVEEPTTPFGQAKEFLTLAGIHHVEQPFVEADDLIAAYWRANRAGHRCYILSGDKDFLQLLDGYTEQIRPGGGADERWTINRVRTEMGCKPDQIPLVMALTGDTSDNIPGVPGFGTKTAVKVLSKHDWDLDAALACPEHVKLAGQRTTVMRNLALVDLRTPIPEIVVAPVPRFTPTSVVSVAYDDLLHYLDRYQLAKVKTRLQDGSLWKDC